MKGIDRPNLELLVNEVWDADEKLQFIQAMVDSALFETGSGIVYFTLIKTLEWFSDNLRERRVPHVCYHGTMERRTRRKIPGRFHEWS